MDVEGWAESACFMLEALLIGGDELLGALRSKDVASSALEEIGIGLGCEIFRKGRGVVDSRLRGSEGHLLRSGRTAH